MTNQGMLVINDLNKEATIMNPTNYQEFYLVSDLHRGVKSSLLLTFYHLQQHLIGKRHVFI